MPAIDTINLHPSTHSPSSVKSTTYDVIFLGAGWPSRITGPRCVAAGLSVLTIEKELIGGDCRFWACIPSKALLRSAEALESSSHLPGARERLTSAHVDATAVFAHRDTFTANWSDTADIVPTMKCQGVTLVRGVGRLAGVKKVRVTLDVGGADAKVETVDFQARLAVVINTGSVATIPDICGLALARPWTPREATSSSIVPETLFIMGGGVVGVEMATIYLSLGSKVFLASRSSELLPGLDPEAGSLVRAKLQSRGARIMTSTSVTKVNRKESKGAVLITVTSDGTEQEISATEILVAAGRQPVTQDIGLETLGLKPEPGHPLVVDESLLMRDLPSNTTDGPWLYAAGDVNGRATLTHNTKYHSRIIANAILARASGRFPTATANMFALATSPLDSFSATADHYAVPQVIFSDPQVASVGLTRSAAQRAGLAFRVATAPVATVGAKLHEGLQYEDGWAQWVLEEKTGILLGATFVGVGVAELLHASTVAVVGRLSVQTLVHAIPAFPTMSEVYLNLIDAAGL